MPTKPSTSKSSGTPAAEANIGMGAAKPNREHNVIEQHSLRQPNSSDERHAQISVVAYRLAEGRGFAPGGELEDWLRAEGEIDGKLKGAAG